MSEVVDDIVDVAPVETQTQLPADFSAPQTTNDSELDRLLQEYTRATEKPEPGASNNLTEDVNKVDTGLADLLGPDPKVGQLQGELDGLKAQMRLAEETKAFNEFSDDLTKRVAEINPHVEDDWVRLKLESVAHDPVARLAWETRSIDPRAAQLDLQYVQHALVQLQAEPNADPAKVQELNKLAHQLNIAAQSPAILRQIRNQIMSDAKKKLPPIDEQVTADVQGLTQYIRDGQGPRFIPEERPNFGIMSDREFKDYTKKHYGF